MITFTCLLVFVIVSNWLYSKKVEKIFGANSNIQTPAIRLKDNVDYIPMNRWKAFMIEFLDIAGLGPIFGVILGAVYGPIALIWIVLGGLIGGALHDYISGMMSVREDGKSIAEVIGKWMGTSAKQFMRFFTLLLMILVGASFMMGPAKILANMTGAIQIGSFVIEQNSLVFFWVIVILAYYFLATLLPIDKIIGRFYPILGLAMLFMAIGVMVALYIHSNQIPEINFSQLFQNRHPQASTHPIFPIVFITIACGAISGFHSTQSPLMARTIKNEKDGRLVFWWAMTSETIVALIWATAAISFFGGIDGLNSYLTQQNYNPAPFVTLLTKEWLGSFGSFLAILGVVAAPITTGDTALRSARLIISDFLNFKQDKIKNRLIVTIPIFIIAFGLTFLKFDALWRLMFWFNQVLATIVLWTISIYLLKNKKTYIISLIPAIFMTAVVTSYVLIAKEAIGWQSNYAYFISFLITIISIFLFFNYSKISKK